MGMKFLLQWMKLAPADAGADRNTQGTSNRKLGPRDGREEARALRRTQRPCKTVSCLSANATLTAIPTTARARHGARDVGATPAPPPQTQRRVLHRRAAAATSATR